MTATTEPTTYPPHTHLCACHGLPADSHVHVGRDGDAMLRWSCPVDGLIVGTVYADDWQRRRDRIVASREPARIGAASVA